jgi:hypothetical protein
MYYDRQFLSTFPPFVTDCGSLILDHVNCASLIADLNAKTGINPQTFQWMRRFKYYIVDGKSVVRMCDGLFDYGYE